MAEIILLPSASMIVSCKSQSMACAASSGADVTPRAARDVEMSGGVSLNPHHVCGTVLFACAITAPHLRGRALVA